MTMGPVRQRSTTGQLTLVAGLGRPPVPAHNTLVTLWYDQLNQRTKTEMEKPRVKWGCFRRDRRGDALPGTSSTRWIGPCSTPSTRR